MNFDGGLSPERRYKCARCNRDANMVRGKPGVYRCLCGWHSGRMLAPKFLRKVVRK